MARMISRCQAVLFVANNTRCSGIEFCSSACKVLRTVLLRGLVAGWSLGASGLRYSFFLFGDCDRRSGDLGRPIH